MKQKIWPLLIVGMLALGTFSVIGLQNGATGDVSGQMSPTIVVGRTSPYSGVAYRPPEFVSGSYNTDRDNILLLCYTFQYEHPGVAPQDIARICSSYGVIL